MYLIFTEDDGWHTNQLTKAFELYNKEVATVKINEASIVVNENSKIIPNKILDMCRFNF